jgi:predicted phage terminase large subunit-like protein
MSNRLNSEDSAIVVIGQRVHEADVPGVILEFYPDYEFLCIPMEFEPAIARRTCIGWEDPRTDAGELAWPDRFSDERLNEFRLQRYLWASQYQQSPHIRGGAIIQDSWWRLWDADEALEQGCEPGKYPPFDYVIGCVDGAFTEKTSNDPSAMTVWGAWQDKNEHTRFMLVYAWSERLEFHGIPENADGSPGIGPDGKPGKLGLVLKVAKTARKYKLDRLLIENKASGISVAQELRRLYSATENWAIRLVDPAGRDKVQRLNAVSAFWEVGLVYAPNTRWAEKVIREVSSFPKGKNDDLTDTCSMALEHFRIVGMAKMPEEGRLYVEAEMTHKKVNRTPLYPTG